MKTTDPLLSLSAFQARIGEPAGSVELKLHPSRPLFIGHFEKVDLRHCPGDIEKRIDTTAAIKSGFDHVSGDSSWLRSSAMVNGSALFCRTSSATASNAAPLLATSATEESPAPAV